MAVVLLEIVSLLWSHPILTGLLILLFTTPLFHIVLFFTPLLMSTALCVIALISIGPQIEKIREERQFKMSLNARTPTVAAERPINRYIVISQGRPQRPAMRLGGDGAAGGRRWADWVKGIEIHGHTIWLSESHIMRDIAEEGLKSDFSHEEGGVAMTSEDSRCKGAFSLEQPILARDDKGVETDRAIEGEEHHHLELVAVRQQDDPLALSSETSIVSLDQLGDRDRGDKLESVELDACSGSVLSIGDTLITEKTPFVSPRANNNLVGLVPIPAGSSPYSTPPQRGDTKFTLRIASSSALKKKKSTSWFRRRRIPCGLSKALGQLREKICNQLRRIFS